VNPDTILIVEDEELLADETAAYFRGRHWEVHVARTAADAREVLLAGTLLPLVVLSDLSLPDGSGLDLMEEVRAAGVTEGEWVFLTGYGTVPDTVRALRLGAFDFLEKPYPIGRLELVVSGAARAARAQRQVYVANRKGHTRYPPDAFVGSSRGARETRALLERICAIPARSVLIQGETGTGKGLVARILHYSGLRASGPLVETNCAALPKELLESELFGHEAGAFTGARGRHRGLFEQAAGGTLFLDEISELDMALQAKLLKVVEERRFRRLGGEREIEVDVQVVAASNRDLQARVREGLFREDLLHRLGVLTIELPPLRDRPEDIESLAWLAIEEFSVVAGRVITTVPEEVWIRLREYGWPGNVRELRNVLERSVLLSPGGVLSTRWLGLDASGGAPAPAAPGEGTLTVRVDGTQTFDEMEVAILTEALRRTRGNVSGAARLLGMSRQTLRYRVEKFGLSEGSAG
jgi:two-component system response regulator AtoC